jgi:hypothetical protein
MCQSAIKFTVLEQEIVDVYLVKQKNYSKSTFGTQQGSSGATLNQFIGVIFTLYLCLLSVSICSIAIRFDKNDKKIFKKSES